MNMADGLNMQPRIGEPESAMTPGMAAPREPNFGPGPGLLIPTSGPGPYALQNPAAWVYDFDPANGLSRASFNGEVNFPGVSPGLVTSFNGRSGAVALTTADVTGAGGMTPAQAAALYTPLTAFQPNSANMQTFASPGLPQPNILECGQITYNGPANTWVPFNFLTPFPTACMVVVGQCSTGGVFGQLICGTLSATQFQVNCSAVGVNVAYLAFGH